MSINIEDFLTHHGVKGQKWGVRKDKGYEGKRAKTKKIEKLDKKFDQNRSMLNTYIKINNIAAKQSNAVDVPRINNKPKYKDQDFTRDTPLRQKYYKEHQDAWVNRLEEAANSLGTNASGTKKYGIIDHGDMRWEVTLRDNGDIDYPNAGQSLYYDGLQMEWVDSIVTIDAGTNLNAERPLGAKTVYWKFDSGVNGNNIGYAAPSDFYFVASS